MNEKSAYRRGIRWYGLAFQLLFGTVLILGGAHIYYLMFEQVIPGVLNTVELVNATPIAEDPQEQLRAGCHAVIVFTLGGTLAILGGFLQIVAGIWFWRRNSGRSDRRSLATRKVK